MSHRIALLSIVALFAGCAAADDRADLLLVGGVVWTGDAAAPTAQGVAIRAGRIIAVGSDTEIRAYGSAATRVIELDGRFVAPGFIDDHTHFIGGGFQLGSVDLRSSATPPEFAARIGAFAQTLPAGRWITGGDWDHELWAGAPLPRREWFDSLTTQHFVAVSRLDGHMMVVNTRVLELAGITRDTPDPAGGTIVRDERTGEPTGVLKDEAMSLVYRVMPEATPAERDEAFRRAQAHALARGVTMVQDMGDWPDLETYRRARASGDLRIRIYSFVPLGTWERLRDFVATNGRGDDQLRWGGLKGFVDGSLGSTTAWFYEPYEDEPGTSGLMVTDTARLRSWIASADAAGLHVAVHAIGERANDWLLDAFDAAARTNGARDRRFRIEHAQHLSPAAIPRFAQMGVLPSMQPYHAIDDGRWAEKRIGADRIQRTYAFRALLDSGANLMFGSDWTVAPIDPLLGIYAAVTRRTIDGANPDGWVPRERITVEEALRGYTAANAYGAFMEDRIGTIRVGGIADLVVLSDDITRIDPVGIPDVQVDHTIVDGAVVHTRDGAADADAERPVTAVQDPIFSISEGRAPADWALNDAGGALLDNGMPVLYNRSDAVLMVFDTAGTMRMVIGGRGNGPGEFARISDVATHGPHIGVWDSSSRRYSIFAGTGEFVQSFRITEPRSPELIGWLAGYGPVMAESEPGANVALEYVVLDTAGTTQLVLAGPPGYARAAISWITGPGRRSQVVVGQECLPTILAAVMPEAVFIADSRTGTVAVLRPHDRSRSVASDAGSRHTIYTERQWQRVTPEVLNVAGEQLAFIPDESLAPYLEAIGNPGDSLPVWSAVIADRAGGRLLLRRTRCGQIDSPARWSVIDTAGVHEGTLELPLGRQLVAASGRWLLATRTDTSGVEYAELYRSPFPR